MNDYERLVLLSFKRILFFSRDAYYMHEGPLREEMKVNFLEQQIFSLKGCMHIKATMEGAVMGVGKVMPLSKQFFSQRGTCGF